MKQIGVTFLTFIWVASAMMSCQPKEAAPPPVDIEQIKKEIQAKENEFAEAYNKREVKAIGYYADDANSFPQNSPALVGKPAIIEYLRVNLDSMPLDDKISFETREVYPSENGEQVVEVGYYKVTTNDGKVINTGNYMTLFVKRDGKYVCLRDMSACDMILE